MIFDIKIKNVIGGNYYAKLFQDSDINKNYEGFHDCYFFVAKELIKGDTNELIEKLFSEKYSPEKYMKDKINIVYFSAKEEAENIFIKSLKKDFNLDDMPKLINTQKY